MAPAVPHGQQQRCVGQGQKLLQLMPGHDEPKGQRQRWVERQQITIAAEFQRRQPGRLAGRCLSMVVVRGGRRAMLDMLMMFAGCAGRGRCHLQRGIQRADMDHQHGEQAKPGTQCR